MENVIKIENSKVMKYGHMVLDINPFGGEYIRKNIYDPNKDLLRTSTQARKHENSGFLVFFRFFPTFHFVSHKLDNIALNTLKTLKKKDLHYLVLIIHLLTTLK